MRGHSAGRAFRNRLLIGKAHVPREVDPGVLADFGDEGVDGGNAGRLGIDAGKMRLWQHLAHFQRRLAGIGQIVDDENAFAGFFQQFRGDAFQQDGIALVQVIVTGCDADCVDQANVEFTRDDGCRNQTAASDADDGLELLVQAGKTPCQRAGIAVKLIPGDWEGLSGRDMVGLPSHSIADGFG